MKLKFFYVLLVLYTLFHLIFSFNNSGVLMDLLNLKADPLVLSLFNLMGIFPLGFLVYAFKYQKISKKDYLYFIFSFMLGAFALTPYFILRKEEPRLRKEIPNVFIYAMMLFSSLLIIYGLLFGSISNYFNLFLSDSFIHIMTLDFIFMIGLSASIFYKRTNKWYVSLFPVIGFYYLMVDNHLKL